MSKPTAIEVARLTGMNLEKAKRVAEAEREIAKPLPFGFRDIEAAILDDGVEERCPPMRAASSRPRSAPDLRQLLNPPRWPLHSSSNEVTVE
jgi:hypothetical protein